MLYNRVFNCFKQHVYYVSINSFIYNVSKNNFLECSTCLQSHDVYVLDSGLSSFWNVMEDLEVS